MSNQGRATVCATITLNAYEIYSTHSARREGSSMISAAILFFDEHGPGAKHGMSWKLTRREGSIRFLQEHIKTLQEQLDLLTLE